MPILLSKPVSFILAGAEVVSLSMMMKSIDTSASGITFYGYLLAFCAFLFVIILIFSLTIASHAARGWKEVAIGIGFPTVIVSPIAIYAWLNLGWPAGGFIFASAMHMLVRDMREDNDDDYWDD